MELKPIRPGVQYPAFAFFLATPRNTAVVAGNNATFHCVGADGSANLYWQHPPLTYIVSNCEVEPAYANLYAVNSTIDGQCDLIVLNASPSSIGLYTCQFALGPSGEWSAYLTVLGEKNC